jgi:hypothetical protein
MQQSGLARTRYVYCSASAILCPNPHAKLSCTRPLNLLRHLGWEPHLAQAQATHVLIVSLRVRLCYWKLNSKSVMASGLPLSCQLSTCLSTLAIQIDV